MHNPRMEALGKKICLSVVLVAAVYLGGRFVGIWGREPREVLSGVMLEQFMGVENFPLRGVILESRAGYLKIRLENGKVIEHSGNYTVIR